MEEMSRIRYVGRASMFSLHAPPPSTSTCSVTWKLAEPYTLGTFYGGFII